MIRLSLFTTFGLVLLPFACCGDNSHSGSTKWTIGEVQDPPADAPVCNSLSKEHLSSFANNKTLLITVVDQLIMRKFGKSWVENVKSAGISYWMVAALDPWTSRLLGHWGVKQCFNAPLDRLRYKGSGGRHVLHMRYDAQCIMPWVTWGHGLCMVI